MWSTGGEAAFLNEMFFIRGGVSPRYEDDLRTSFGVGLIPSVQADGISMSFNP
ncbi:MAG TPA: hypothetical protein VGD14_00235 [bacterium]